MSGVDLPPLEVPNSYQRSFKKSLSQRALNKQGKTEWEFWKSQLLVLFVNGLKENIEHLQ